MKQGTFYLTEDEHKDFKARCASDGISMTDKIKSLIMEYIKKEPSSKKTPHNI